MKQRRFLDSRKIIKLDFDIVTYSNCDILKRKSTETTKEKML